MFTKDTRTETFLTQMGVEFTYTNSVSVDELADGWDHVNLSRPTPLREDAIVEYATLMENGSPAPAPILHRTSVGYSVLDGVQRVSAAILRGSTRLAAYAVTCDSDDILSAIRVLANARLQGCPEPPEWTRRRAVEVLVVQRGLSVEEVAHMGGWRSSDVQAIAHALEWGLAIQAIGGPALPDTMIQVVAKHVSKREISDAPEPTAEFLRIVKAAKFSASDAEPYVRDFFSPVVKARKRYEVLLSRLNDFKHDPEVQIRIHGRRGFGIPADVNLRRAMKTVVTVLEEIEQSGESLLYVDEFFKLLKDIDKKLHSLAKSHPKAEAVAVPADKWIK